MAHRRSTSQPYSASPCWPPKPNQARLAHTIGAVMTRSGWVLQRSKNRFDSPMDSSIAYWYTRAAQDRWNRKGPVGQNDIEKKSFAVLPELDNEQQAARTPRG